MRNVGGGEKEARVLKISRGIQDIEHITEEKNGAKKKTGQGPGKTVLKVAGSADSFRWRRDKKEEREGTRGPNGQGTNCPVKEFASLVRREKLTVAPERENFRNKRGQHQ